MSDLIRLYAGTEAGLSTWRATRQGWQQVGARIGTNPCRAVDGSSARPDCVCAGFQGDGIYRTEDAGEHWTKVFDGDIWSIAADPANDRVMYAGTAPVHLYRSEDGGRHWEELTALRELPAEVRARQTYPPTPGVGHILNIFIDPGDARTIYLALEHGGVIRTLDGGKSFEDVSQGFWHFDIHMAAKAPDRERYYTAASKGFFSTTDPAQGWVPAENGFTRDYFYKFIVMPARRTGDSATMLVSTADHDPSKWRRPEHARGAIFRSIDYGDSWHRVGVGRGLPEEMRERAWEFVRHPVDPDGVFAALGCAQLGRENSGPGTVALSRDRGESWEKIDIPVRSVWGIHVAPDE